MDLIKALLIVLATFILWAVNYLMWLLPRLILLVVCLKIIRQMFLL